jgi:hypothetical protein
MKPYIALAALMALTAPAAAQQFRPDPTDPAAVVPPVKHESAFVGYAPYREQTIAPWRDVNDEVARTGGHAGIFRGHGTQAPARSPEKPPAAGAAAKPGATTPPRPAGKPPAQDYGGRR